jgi:hypothetical protein
MTHTSAGFEPSLKNINANNVKNIRFRHGHGSNSVAIRYLTNGERVQFIRQSEQVYAADRSQNISDATRIVHNS